MASKRYGVEVVIVAEVAEDGERSSLTEGDVKGFLNGVVVLAVKPGSNRKDLGVSTARVDWDTPAVRKEEDTPPGGEEGV